MPCVRRTALPGRSQSSNDQLAKGLGYFSLALGLVELVAPRTICRAIGLDGHEGLARAYGVRELATGIAILTSHDAAPWIWGRVAGDAADIATVAAGAQNIASAKTMFSMAALAGAAALDFVCATRLSSEKGQSATALADYSDRSGFPLGLQAARAAARRPMLTAKHNLVNLAKLFGWQNHRRNVRGRHPDRQVCAGASLHLFARDDGKTTLPPTPHRGSACHAG